MKILPDEPILTLMGKLLLYAVKETIFLSCIFIVGGILLGNTFMSFIPAVIILTWIQGYFKGRTDEVNIHK